MQQQHPGQQAGVPFCILLEHGAGTHPAAGHLHDPEGSHPAGSAFAGGVFCLLCAALRGGVLLADKEILCVWMPLVVHCWRLKTVTDHRHSYRPVPVMVAIF